MTIKKIKLTEHSIKSFKKQDKTYNVWDTVESNLYISVTKKSKTYIFYKKTPLKQVRKHIGNVKDIKLTDARKQAHKLLESFNDIKINEHTGLTFCQFLMEYEKKIIPKWAKGTILTYRSYLNYRILPYFKKFTLKEIKHKHVYEWFIKSSQSKKGASNRSLEILRAMFYVAMEWGYMEVNPTVGIKKNKRRKMIEYLNHKNIKKLGAYLDKDIKKITNPNPPRIVIKNIVQKPPQESVIKNRIKAINIIKILLVTGCRLNEIQSLKWEYITGKYIHLPHTKTGKRKVFINTSLKKILRTIKTDKNGYIFPRESDKKKHFNNTYSYWLSIRNELNFNNIRLHDLRHTFATLSMEQGLNLPTVSKMLGHATIETTTRYLHTTDKQAIQDNQKISNVIEKLLQ